MADLSEVMDVSPLKPKAPAEANDNSKEMEQLNKQIQAARDEINTANSQGGFRCTNCKIDRVDQNRLESRSMEIYAVSITGCSSKLQRSLYDAAAVLKRSIELNAYPLKSGSRYAAKFYAFTLKPEDGSDPARVDRCYQILSKAGYEVVPQDKPIYTSLIQEPKGAGGMLKNGISSDGCCGDKELIKLATYKLTDHNIAVHLDLDTLVIQPLDELYNVMHYDSISIEGKQARKRLADLAAPTYINRRLTGNPSESFGHRMSPEQLFANITVNAYFTKDYNMIVPQKYAQSVGVQGGVLIVRPSMAVYTHLISAVYSGEFYGGFDGKTSGWFKKGYGKHIWGSMTIQGLLAYYFDVEELENAVELNKCRYNNIADNARISTFAKNPKFPRGTLLPFVRNASNDRYNFVDTQCRDGRKTCDDTNCQRFPLSEIRIVHYTYCKTPWKCNGCDYLETYKEPLCYEMTREWFKVRKTIPGEENVTMADVIAQDDGPVSYINEHNEVEVLQGNCYKEFYLGYCREHGGYKPMVVAG